ncbi:acyl-CoA synthetase family member 2, mitochondrial [Ceratina calcarata]|uniref:Medium-chain acyl-CoA ligase ACSF2, mitochondrial n=1 Tax=Ceratina calcarata TaxID=156304 RepID=A0AAJ7N4X0_9HYME|nr:acyl-CoA synthetase family member 2, mitochondrial [Ceratina calcarata]
MLRTLVTRKSFLPSVTSICAHKDVENFAFVCTQVLKLRCASQHRSKHQGNIAHILNHGKIPLVDETIGKLLATAADTWPDRECVVSVHQNVRLTFSDLIRRADRLAAGFVKLGLMKGDRLGIWAPNDVEWLITFMAAARAGLILVAINPAYQVDEVVYCLQKVSVKAVISPTNFKTQNYPRMLLQAKQACPALEHIIIYSEDHVTGTRRFSDVEMLPSRIEVERIAAEQDEISCHAGSNIQFTSGTTGKPKATLLSHRSLLNNAKQGVVRAQYHLELKACLNVPYFHAFGILKGLLCSFHSGYAVVLQGRSFNPVHALEATLREKCTMMFGTPTMWINMLDAKQRMQLPAITLSYGVTGGSPASPELFKQIKESFNFNNMKTIYGLTEVTGVNFLSLPNEDPELTENTVGCVTDHIEVMVVDEKGEPVSFDTPGELWIRGYCVMKEYWGDEENTKKAITKDGWFKTGDQFVLRKNGYGCIVGRLKDMLIRGGENIFPKDIEDVLMTHPEVLEVQVIGAYDEVYGEEVCACVRLRKGASPSKEQLKEYCKGRMAPFKIPRYIVFVDEYPKTASGKVQKYKLRKELEHKDIIPSASRNSGMLKRAEK